MSFIVGVTSSDEINLKARSTAFASGVKETSCMHCILQSLSDITAHQPLCLLLTHLYKSIDNPYNEFVVFLNRLLICLDLLRFYQSASQKYFRLFQTPDRNFWYKML